MTTRHSLFSELKRRNVLRAAVLYIGAAWALSQGVAQLLPVFGFDNWVVRWFVIAAAIGFPFAMLFSWFYEWTPQGIQRESEIVQDESVAQNAFDQTQQAMDSSTTKGQPVIAQPKLAGAARIARTVSNDPVGDLDFLQRSAEVAALRDYWAADVIVYLTTGNGNLQGIANIPQNGGLPPPGPGFAPYAIAVSLAAYATNPGDYVFAHEFAHTFGANHNPDHLPVNTTPVRPWAFGHWGREPETG